MITPIDRHALASCAGVRIRASSSPTVRLPSLGRLGQAASGPRRPPPCGRELFPLLSRAVARNRPREGQTRATVLGIHGAFAHRAPRAGVAPERSVSGPEPIAGPMPRGRLLDHLIGALAMGPPGPRVGRPNSRPRNLSSRRDARRPSRSGAATSRAACSRPSPRSCDRSSHPCQRRDRQQRHAEVRTTTWNSGRAQRGRVARNGGGPGSAGRQPCGEAGSSRSPTPENRGTG